MGIAQGTLAARGDDLGHGLGLGQVHAPVDEGAPGKLAGFGLARAELDEQLE